MKGRNIVTRIEKLETSAPEEPLIVFWNDGTRETAAKVRRLEAAGRRVFFVGWQTPMPIGSAA